MPIYRPLEDLTATLLQRLLGRYITGLEGRNLRVAVWSGRVVLENLTLRPDALVGLLPVGVRAGFVGRIEMSVPWHKLGSSPVTLELHDVFMLAMPLNEAGRPQLKRQTQPRPQPEPKPQRQPQPQQRPQPLPRH